MIAAMRASLLAQQLQIPWKQLQISQEVMVKNKKAKKKKLKDKKINYERNI